LFAALGAASVRFLGFFAVVTGPVAALNLQEAGRRRAAGGLTWRQWNWAVGGRLLTALGGLVLLVLAWPGWLHGRADDPRWAPRVQRRVYIAPGLARAARRLDALAARGLGRGFNVAPPLAAYLAWFGGRDVRIFFDRRFLLSPQAAEDYARARRNLRDASQPRA